EWNAAAGRVFDGEPTEARDRGCARVLDLHEGERAFDCAHGCALLARPGAGTEGVEVWRRRPDGSRQPLLAYAEPIRSQSGDVEEVVHSFRDITRLKEADEAKTMFLA